MDTNRARRPTKPSACEACNHRKIKCDSAVIGFPCSTCTNKGRSDSCTPVIRKPRKRKRPLSDDEQSSQILSPSDTILSETVRNAGLVLPQPLNISEDDAQVHTLCHMSGEDNASWTPQSLSTPLAGQHMQYYSPLNTLTVFGEALGLRRRRRLIQLDLSSTRKALIGRERERFNLEQDDLAYLEGKRVFNYPSKHVW